MSLKLAYNTTDTAIVVDDAGYSIGGHEFGAVEDVDGLGSAELAAGRLVLVDEDAAKDSTNPTVMAALVSLEQRRSAVAAAKKLDKETLVEAVPADVLETMETGGDNLPAKDDLVDAVVAADAVPEPPAKKTTSSRTAAKK